MDASSRIVFGYHGAKPAIAESILRGHLKVDDWLPSANDYDWLGNGIYFWEYAPERAKSWTDKGSVVGAIINLGNCLDLTDTRFTDMLSDAYRSFAKECKRKRMTLPKNTGKRRDLDSAVINYLVNSDSRNSGIRFHSVRGAFLEGEPVFPGSAILSETHIQIAVRDVSCILGLFRPT